MRHLILGLFVGLIGTGYLVAVAISFFLGGTWGARLAYGLIGAVALFVSVKLLRLYFIYVRIKRSELSQSPPKKS